MIAQVIVDGILIGGIYALISIGLTVIFGVMRIINFAHGEYLMVAMYSSYLIFGLLGLNPYLSLVIVVPFLFIIGVVSYYLVIHPIIHSSELSHVFATLGLGLALQGLALYLFGGDFRSVPFGLSRKIITLGPTFINISRLIALLVAIGAIFALSLFLKKTYTGKAIRAASQNPVSAQLMGVSLKSIYMITFGIGTAIVGLAGGVLMPIYAVFPSIGGLFVLVTFVVVVLGGIGSIFGALAGGIVIGMTESLSGFFIAPALKEGIYFIIFVLILLFKPSGLFGKKA